MQRSFKKHCNVLRHILSRKCGSRYAQLWQLTNNILNSAINVLSLEYFKMIIQVRFGNEHGINDGDMLKVRWMDGWIDGLINGWMDRWMNQKIDWWANEWGNGWEILCFYSFSIENSFIFYHKSWSIYSMRYSNLYQHLDYINQTLIQPSSINPNHLLWKNNS